MRARAAHEIHYKKYLILPRLYMRSISDIKLYTRILKQTQHFGANKMRNQEPICVYEIILDEMKCTAEFGCAQKNTDCMQINSNDCPTLFAPTH